MKITSGRVLERLPAEEPCLGALWTSYSFDPAFFEEHVLRAVLRLTSDPVEQAERYHLEAQRALQESPVVAIVDAAERRPGRRLPYDLLEVSTTVFHAKSTLLLYRTHARLMLGSGNLTFSGYGGNAELFLCLQLTYKDKADAALLTIFDEHLSRLRKLVRHTGTQFDLFRDELRRRLGDAPRSSTSNTIAFLDSTKGPIIEQLKALLPEGAVVKSLGMLAPFYERDDASELDATSVFGFLAPQAAEGITLDVGIAWDNPQVQASETSQLEAGLNRIWTWSRHGEGTRSIEHIIPASIGPNSISYFDEAGQGRRWPLAEVQEAIEQRDLWMQPQIVAFAPRNTISNATKRFSEVRLWLHPATRLVNGRPIHRPLHAKLLAIGFTSGTSKGTLVLMGSSNMSRRALLMQAGAGLGNVETGLAFRIDAALSLRDFVPELIHAPRSALELKEREFPDHECNHALAIDEATYNPQAHSLVVTWAATAVELPAWRLTYGGKSLAESDTSPITPLTIEPFDLKATTAEIVLHVDGREYSVPILVTDLAALPAGPAGSSMNLEELLMLLGRRIGIERATQVAGRRVAGEDDALGSFFGEGFTPTDVFRAWWAVAEDLKDPNLSVPAFRLRLEGTLGVGAAWSCMLEAVNHATLPVEEAWFYGAELLREIANVKLPLADDQEAKTKILSGFRDRVQKDLASITFDDGSRPWVERILTFYEGVGT